MEIIKHFATQRGVEAFSFSGVVLPTDIALDSDQMAPLLVAAATHTFSQSGLMTDNNGFPWTLDVDADNDVALIDGTHVVEQSQSVADSIGYLFLDYEIERIVVEHRLDPDANPAIVSLDSLADKLEVIEHEPNWAKRTPFNPSV